MTFLPNETTTQQMATPTHILRRAFIGLQTTGVISLLIAMAFLGFALVNPRFTNLNNLINILNQASYLSILALGQGLVLISGGFDLAVAGILGLTSVISVTVLVALIAGGVSVPFAIAIAIVTGLAVGFVLGLINGVAVAKLGVPSFIVTLGVAGVATGAGYQISGGIPVTGLPQAFLDTFGTPNLRSISMSVYTAAALALLTHIVMNRTRIGRYIYAVGGNAMAARLSGVNVARYTISVFVVSGLFASLAGILLSARVATGDTNLGGNFVLQSITAGVLGGISLRGGEGTIIGAVLGALFIAILANGMNLENISSYYQMIILGVLLVLAVLAERGRAFLAGRR